MIQPKAIYLSDFERFERQAKIGLQTLGWIEAGNTPSTPGPQFEWDPRAWRLSLFVAVPDAVFPLIAQQSAPEAKVALYVRVCPREAGARSLRTQRAL
jgi:hypothetical protein